MITNSHATQDHAADAVITRVPISLPCCLPVLPGTPDTDAPIEQRTEKCAVDAWWVIGAVPTCDLHLQKVCEIAGWDYEEILDDFDGGTGDLPNDTERKPWGEQHRYAQAECRYLGDAA